MKKILILMLALCAVSAGQAQEAKPKVAIYTDDQSKKGYAEYAGEMLTNAIVKRGDYNAYERTTSFLKQINAEHAYGRSGAVDENTIASVGKQLGVQYVCAVKIGVMDGSYYISAKLIEVQTAEITGMARPKTFTGISNIEDACDAVIASIFGERGNGSGKRTSSGSTGSGGKSNGATYNPDGIEMVYVAGTGSGILATKGFYIGKYEVTQAQWRAIMGTNPSNFAGCDNCPVEQVSWNDAKSFISKLNSATGRTYALPTEAQWVYAANGGTNNDTYEYAGSNSIGEVAWYGDNSGSKTHTVGTKKANSIGIHDMSGNVWEWCEDCSDSSCSNRVVRGGSWYGIASYCRVAFRGSFSPGLRISNLGFRLVLVP